MKKILLLTTGGTIACVSGKDGFVPSLSGKELLSFIPGIDKAAYLDVIGVMNIDSSNMQPEDWITISQYIFDNIDAYDAFVVLHGTDTLAYTSSAVSFMTLGITKPVIFTGSQIPIANEKSDGRKNLFDAIHVACISELTGVYVVFGGKIMLGCCTSKTDTMDFQAFQSINCRDVGSVEDGSIKIWHYPHALNCSYPWHMKMDKRVFLWKLTPGVSPDLLGDSIVDYYKVVVLEAFGVGGLPMLRNSFLPKIKEWGRRNILTVVTTQCYHGRCDMSIYETGRLALNKGAVCAGNMTREALITKLMWCLTITEKPDEITRLLRYNCCGEFGL